MEPSKIKTHAKRGKTLANEFQLVFKILIGSEICTVFLSQSRSVGMQKQNNCEITLDARLKSRTYANHVNLIVFTLINDMPSRFCIEVLGRKVDADLMWRAQNN